MATRKRPAKTAAPTGPTNAGRAADAAQAAAYEAKRRREAARNALQAQKGRDIGGIPEIANLRRRTRCRKSLRHFCETYNKEAFGLRWSADHLKAISRIEEAATHGALYAYAMPRGSGKSTIARMAALWAVSYGLRRYVFLIGANASKAEDSLQAIKTCIRFLPDYAEDFPEIAWAVRALGGIANRASGQLCQEAPTLIEWGKGRIVLPTVPPPPNWPKAWPLRADGMVPTSGSVVSASGLTGDGIRGSLLTLSTGEAIRPDLVLLDDPQTNESAHSPAQNDTREQLVSADVLGMAGPGKTISAVMPCTVIARGDFIDRILDRSKHPLWRGERTKLLRTMPTNMGAWDGYFELYRHCAQKEPPDFGEANAYYREHRAELDEGAEASWAERKLPSEVSAIQHSMNLYLRDPRAFAAEYQNDPHNTEQDDTELTADQVAGLTNGLPRAKVPLWATRLTAFVDVQKEVLFYVVAAFSDEFTGAVIDYGTYPGQNRAYFTLRDLSPTLAEATGVAGLEAQIYRGLGALAGKLLGVVWDREDGQQMRVERLGVDANWQTELVRLWARQCGHGQVLPTHGRYYGASATPIGDGKKKPGERRGLRWVWSKHLLFDSNWWKTHLAARLATPYPGRGSLTLWGERERSPNHRLFADQVTAERREKVQARDRIVDEWKVTIGQENHYLDALVGCCVLASVQGCALADLPNPARPKVEKVSFKEMQRQAREKREREGNRAGIGGRRG